jgi:hypothetical protein
MTEQHTPGPWAICEVGNKEYVIQTRDIDVAETYFANGNGFANARLIEAAPEMWDLIVELFEDPKLSLIIGGNPNRVSALMARADKLRAKVRGAQ